MTDYPNFEYSFTIDEAKKLLKLFRANENMQEKLKSLYMQLESYIYSVMTIDEVESFLL